MSDDNNDFGLSDLDDAEQTLLAQLIRLIVRTDGELSGGERERIDLIANEAGEGFWDFMDQASESAADEGSILEQASAIGNRDAQELIYGTLYELSITDGTDGDENNILDSLAATWKLDIEDLSES